MNEDTARTILALTDLALFAIDTQKRLAAGELTPEQVQAEWDRVDKSLFTAWEKWDAS